MTATFLVFAFLDAAFVVIPFVVRHGLLGIDFAIYQDRAASWLNGDGFYRARQLAGPYQLETGDALYPPTLLLLLVPFRVLPSVLWWVIPIGLVAYALWHHRPSPWSWPLLAFALAWPKTIELLLTGNPAMWTLGAVAAGTIWTWPFVFAALKPVIAPFALLGVRQRSWWFAAAALAVVSLAFGSLWLDYARALLGLRGADDLYYLFGDLPAACAIVLAWVAGSAKGGKLNPQDAAAQHR